MIGILLSILGWGFLFWYTHNHPIENVSYKLRGGGGGGDETPPIPTRMSPESVISGSTRLSELDQMIREYIGKQYAIPAEWRQYGDVLQRLLNYVPELTYLQEPTEYAQMAEGLQNLLRFQPQLLQEPTEYGLTSSKLQELMGYQPERFQLPIEDIQGALAAQQALQLEQYQKQLRPVLASQGQLDSTYYANLLGDYLRNQQAQTYGTTADLLTQQALQNAQIQQWLPQFQAGIAQALQNVGGSRAGINQYNLGLLNALPQFQAGILGQIGNLGQVRQGVNQYNTQLRNALAQWLPTWQQNIASSIGNLGSTRLGLEQANLMLPLSTYIPGLSQLYNMGQNAAEIAYQDQLAQYQGALNEYNQKQAQRSAFGGIMGNLLGAGIGALATAGTGGMTWPIGMALGSSIGGSLSPLWGGSGQTAIPLSTSLSAAYPSAFGSNINLSSILGRIGNTGSWGTNNYGLDLSGLTSSQYRPGWANTRIGRNLYDWY